MTSLEFQVGDLVTRDGTDVQRVIEVIEIDLIRVVCIREPLGFLNDDGSRAPPWCTLGEEEINLSRRYSFAGHLIDAGATSFHRVPDGMSCITKADPQ